MKIEITVCDVGKLSEIGRPTQDLVILLDGEEEVEATLCVEHLAPVRALIRAIRDGAAAEEEPEKEPPPASPEAKKAPQKKAASKRAAPKKGGHRPAKVATFSDIEKDREQFLSGS